MSQPHPDLDNLDHDPELAAALGNMIVAWARAETALVNVFALVTAVDFNMASVACYRIPSFEARCKVIQALLEVWPLHPPTRRVALAKHVQKLKNLAAARNRWVHGLWCLEERTGKTVLFDLRQPESESKRRRIVKANDVLNHTKAVRLRTEAIDELVPLKIRKVTAAKRAPSP